MKALSTNSIRRKKQKKSIFIISMIALVHFLFTLPFQLYLGLSFSVKEYLFLEPLFKMLTLPDRWVIQTGIFDGMTKGTSNTLVTILAILSAFLYAILFYVIGLLLLRAVRNLGEKRNQTPKQA